MSLTPPKPLASRLSSLARPASMIVAAMGAAVLVGWSLDISLLKSIFPGLAAMKPNSAACMLLSGLSLWLLLDGRPAQVRLGQACALPVAVLGFLTAGQYLMGWELGIDELLFREHPAAVGADAGVRMGTNTAVNFLMIGSALFLLDVEIRRRMRPAQYLSLLAALVAFVTLTGYGYSVTASTGISSYTKMAVHTAIGFVVLSVGILCARPQSGLMAVLVSETQGGNLARRLLPVAFVPILLGFIRLEGERLGYYRMEFGVALFAVMNILVFGLIFFLYATWLDRIDLKRQIAEREVRQLNLELEDRVRRRTAELEASNKELEAFTYSVSHDLRSPLRHIDGFSQLLVEEHSAEISEEARGYLEKVRGGAQQMGQLVDDLLNLARVGRRELNVQITGLNSLVEEAKAGLANETENRKVEWRVEQLPFVECDPALMKQVFANLLSNALKYARPRECALIEVGQVKENSQTAVFVRDNGVGFSMKYADKLFGVFQRFHRQEDFEGTGVGLATVQRIIHKHGGRVWAEAELDKGATFYFTLGTDEDQSGLTAGGVT